MLAHCHTDLNTWTEKIKQWMTCGDEGRLFQRKDVGVTTTARPSWTDGGDVTDSEGEALIIYTEQKTWVTLMLSAGWHACWVINTDNIYILHQFIQDYNHIFCLSSCSLQICIHPPLEVVPYKRWGVCSQRMLSSLISDPRFNFERRTPCSQSEPSTLYTLYVALLSRDCEFIFCQCFCFSVSNTRYLTQYLEEIMFSSPDDVI